MWGDNDKGIFASSLVLTIALALGVAAASFASRLQDNTETQWRAVGNVGELGRNLETLQGLRTRIGAVSETGRFAVSYAADFAITEIDEDLNTLLASQVRPEEVAEVKKLVANYVKRARADINGRDVRPEVSPDEVLDPEYVPIRVAVAELGNHVTEAAISSGQQTTLLSWTFFPTLLVLCGLAVVLNARQRRLVIQRTTERREAAKFEAIVGGSRDVITVINPRGEFEYTSPAARTVFGDALKFDLALLLDEADCEHLLVADRQVRETGRSVVFEATVRCSDGSTRYFELAGSRPEHSGLAGSLWTWHDVHDRKTLENELKHQAFHDPLTSLANRALFQSRLDHALTQAQRSGADTSLLFLDLDGFKNVNDSLGHDAGDAVLGYLARFLQEAVRPGDTLARLGGDEFAILLEATSPSSAREFADLVLTKARTSFALPVVGDRDVEIEMTASIGVATASPTTNAVELLRNADMAMYAAKHSGKNCVRAYDTDMHLVASDRLRIQSAIRQALVHNEFRVHYQPLVDLVASRVVGFEALVRWEHPQRGLLAPNTFIPIAEENGSILEIGRWVLEAVARDAAAIAKLTDAPLKINVNLSPKQLRDVMLIPVLEAALRDHNLDPSMLVLEITETALLDEVDEALHVLGQIRALGIRLALDDFGTGYSTLSSLRSLPIDIVKIDRSFLRNELGDNRSSLVAESIIAMGRQLGLETVAEGIETQEQLDRMRSLGCGTGQGFLFSKAVPLGEIEAVIGEIQTTLRSDQMMIAK